jgi:hypothetical protein
MNFRIFFIRGQWGSRAAGGWFEAGKLLRLAADLDVGVMRVAVVETDGTSAGGKILRASFTNASHFSCGRLENSLFVGPSA